MINLDPWQQEILDTKGDTGLNTGRRVGKTYIFSRKAIDHMIRYGKPIIVVSLTEDQAMIIIQMALNYARETYPQLVGKGKYKPTMKTLTIMRQGKPIVMKSRPVGSSGDATRGFEGGVLFVDEASRMPKIFWIAALPVLLTMAGEVWMCSTPHGKQGYYWKRYNESMNLKAKDARFKFFHQNTEDVINNRKISSSWTKEQREGALRILASDKKDMSELEYGQEYMGLFLEELSQFFADDLILSRMTINRHKIDQTNIRDNKFLGVDVAGMGGDEIVELALERTDRNILNQIDQIVKVKQRIPDTIRSIKRSNEKWNFKKIGIDVGGIGAGVFHDLLEDTNTKRKVVALSNASKDLDHKGEKKTKLLKEDMYTNLLVLMQQGKINLFKDEKLRESLRDIQAEYKNGKLRIFGNYTHITEALIRAAWLAKTKHLKLWVRSV